MVKSEECGAVDATVMNDVVVDISISVESGTAGVEYVDVSGGAMCGCCFVVFGWWILVI